jgi:hypothetical protein
MIKENDILEAVYSNDINKVKELLPLETEQNKLNMAYYMACSEGILDIVITFLDHANFTQGFNEKLQGCTLIEYGIQGASHKEGKKVLNYLIKNHDINLSPSMHKWLHENKLDKIQEKITSKKMK